jgi:hypothetical protein
MSGIVTFHRLFAFRRAGFRPLRGEFLLEHCQRPLDIRKPVTDAPRVDAPEWDSPFGAPRGQGPGRHLQVPGQLVSCYRLLNPVRDRR